MRRRRESSVALVFAARGTTLDDERWIASGWRDDRLSPAGRRQAVELGEAHAGADLAAVFSSDLGAAAETARIAFGARGVQLFLDWRLRDCDLGELTGERAASVEAARSQHVYEPFPGGESYMRVAERVRGFLHDLSPRYRDERIAVVGHLATKWALDHVLQGVPLRDLVAGPFRWQPGWEYRLQVDP